MARRMVVYRGEYAAGHPTYDPASPAACRRHDGPLEDITNIVYSEQDDKAIEEWIRKSVSTAWHSMSTCPMGKQEDGGVVDARLNVHGVKGLRVAGEPDSRRQSRPWVIHAKPLRRLVC